MRLRSDWYERAAFGIIGVALSVYVLVGLATCTRADEPNPHVMSVTPLESTMSPYVVRIDGFVFYCIQRQCQPVDFYVDQQPTDNGWEDVPPQQRDRTAWQPLIGTE